VKINSQSSPLPTSEIPRFARKAADAEFAERLIEIRAKYGSLTAYLHRKETKAMNALQDNGIISDECIFASHVHDSDCQRAIEWLVSPIQMVCVSASTNKKSPSPQGEGPRL
jgi:chloramphenicol 3-O-phosphotransferase